MKTQQKLEALAVWASVAWAAGFAQSSAVAAQYAPESFPSGIEVMTRGAVHEAFGGPINYNPEPGTVVAVDPPSLINELPPSDRPDDPNCLWIPGYWSWDDDEEAYVWVSGMWRIPPPNEVWVAGYWAQTDEGYQWTPGFWQSIAAEDIQYYSAPPESLESGPVGLPPTPDSIWVPGCWRPGHETWSWETGRWIRPVPEWVWVPSHWVWTPGGYVLVEGYWDRVPARRGMLFAPIHYRRPIYTEVHYVYSPTIVIQIEALLGNLFSRPRHSHYYFGDYYESDYDRRGIYPWYECNRPRHGWYDPIYSYEGWRHRSEESHWRDSERKDYEYRRDHREARPPRTYAAEAAPLRGVPDSRHPNIVMAQSLTQIINNQTTIINTNTTNIQIVKVDPASRTRIAQQDKELRQLRDERSRWETEALKGKGERNARGEKKTMELAKPLAVKPILTSFVQPTPTPTATRTPLAQKGKKGPGKPGKATPIATPAEVRPPAKPEIIQVGPAPKGLPTVTPMPAPTASPKATEAPKPTPMPQATPTATPGRKGRGRAETATPTATPQTTAPPRATVTPAATATPTAKATPRVAATPTPAATKMPKPTKPPTARPTATATPTATPTPKAVKIHEPTPTASPTPKATPRETATPKRTKPPTPSAPSPTPSKTKPPKETPTASPTSASGAASQPSDTPQPSETKKRKKG